MVKNDYYYISDINGSIKGIIGELLFKVVKKNVYCTNICLPIVVDNLPFQIPLEILMFLKKNWYTIDSFEFVLEKKLEGYTFVNVILYEVKTMNYYSKDRPSCYRKLKFTRNQIDIYKKAQKLGMIVKIAKVILFEKGKYLVNILDFDSDKYRYKICNGSSKVLKIIAKNK